MFVMPEACVGGGALLFDLDSTVVSLAATSLSQQCIVYFPEGAAAPPWVPGIASTPAPPPPTAPPSRRCWSLSYLFSVAVLGSTGFPAAGPVVVPVSCAKATPLTKSDATVQSVSVREARMAMKFSFLSMRHLLYAPFTNVEAGHWLRLDPDNPFMEELQDRSLGAQIVTICL